MQGPLAPGEKPRPQAPLPKAALLVGALLAGLAVFLAAFRPLARDLLADATVVRALGATLAVAGGMLSRVAWLASAGTRRLAALSIASPVVMLGVSLLVMPALAHALHDRQLGFLLPWVFGVPSVAALLLSRWRVS